MRGALFARAERAPRLSIRRTSSTDRRLVPLGANPNIVMYAGMAMLGSAPQAYAQALLASGKVEEAASVSGKLSPWSQQDWRAAWTQACVYRALGQTAFARQYRDKAQQLAGDRVLPDDVSVFMY